MPDNSIKVFKSNRDTTCEECGADLAATALITLDNNRKPHCLTCSDLDHLVYLPSGDAALSWFSMKYQWC